MSASLVRDRFAPAMKSRLSYAYIHRYAFSQNLVEGKRVLDAACGDGLGTAILANRAAHVVGLDNDAAIVGSARRGYGYLQNCMFMTGDIAKLPFADGEFDVVVSFEALQHAGDLEAVIVELSRVLKRDGLLIVSMHSQRPVAADEETAALLSRHFAAHRILHQRFLMASAIDEVRDGAIGQTHYEAFTRDAERPIEIHASTTRLKEPEYSLFLCSKLTDGVPLVAPSLYLDPKDDLWQEQLAINRWVEGLAVEEEKVRRRNVELEQMLASLTHDVDLSRNESETLRRLLELNKRRLGLIEEESRTLSTTLAEVVRRSGQLSDFVVTLQNEIASDRSKQQQFIGQVFDEQALRRQAEVDLISVRGELEARRNLVALAEQHHELELSRLVQRVETVQAELTAKAAEAAETERAQRERLEMREGEIEEIRGQLEEATSRAQGMSQRLETCDREIEQLKEKLAEASGREAALRAAIETRDAEVGDLTVRLQALQQSAAIVTDKPSARDRRNHAEQEDVQASPVSLALDADDGVSGVPEVANRDESEALRGQLKEARSRLFERALHIAEFNRKFAEHNLPNPVLPSLTSGPAASAPTAPANADINSALAGIPGPARAPASPDIRLNGRARPTQAQSGEAAKQRFRADSKHALAEFLAGGERLVLPTSATPRVSIVMVLYNQAELTFECLRTMPAALDVPSELIIVDNGSTDDTHQLLAAVSGARVIRSGENLHFLRGVNRAAQECKGDAILLLNNDTTIRPGSLAAALRRLDEESDAGAVGGKIVSIDGTLQEAGSIIWNDGSCLGYGRGRLAREPEFSFTRDVDYCSGAFLLVRRSLFETLGRLDTAFAPAYYEETDLCMRIREAGFRVVYDPSVEIKHFEFGSSSSPQKAIDLQTRNRKIFVDRHRATLQASHLPPASRPLDARMKPLEQKRLLVLDDRLPNPQLGQGFPRAHSIHTLLLKQGWFLTFYPTSFPGIDWNEAYRLYPRNVEIASDSGRAGLKAFLTKRAGYYDAMLVSRPHNMELVNSLIAQDHTIIGRTKIIYDAEALIAPREAMKRALLGRSVPANDQLRAIEAEVKLGKAARAILAVNEAEAHHFRSVLGCPVSVIGHAIDIAPTPKTFEERTGLLFVGALDADDTPNVDSLVWFIKEIMPKIDKIIGPSWVLHAAGSNRSARARALAGPRLKLLGMVEDLSGVYNAARVFIAPTRYAAGIPMKVHEAAAAGVPSVVTPLLAKQLNWVDRKDLVVGATAEEFAEGCAKLYTDQALWERVREGALASVRKDCDYASIEKKLAGVMSEVEIKR